MPEYDFSNKPSFLEWLRGKRTSDIELPSEGTIDPRLAEGRPDVLGAIQQAAKGFKSLQENEAMKSLYNYGKK